MKYKIFLGQVVITSILTLAIGLPLATAFAETKAPVSVKVEVSSPAVDQAKTNASGFWDSTKAWGTGVYNKIDGWRLSQLETWKAIKAEKEAQITAGTDQLDANRNQRVDNVLNEQAPSLTTGAGQDIGGNGHVFLLKLYSFVIFLFIIILSTPVIFYGAIIIIIVSVLFKIGRMITGHDY